MTAQRTWIDSLSDGFFEVSFDKMLRDLITAYRKRERMSARRFGDLALGDRGFISHRLRDGSSVALKTADKGRLVYVNGTLRTNRWRKDGEDADRFSTEIRLAPGGRLQFLDKRAESAAAAQNPQELPS